MHITSKMNFVKNLIFVLIICFSFGLSTSCQTKPQTAEESIKACQSFLDKDDLQGANECIQKAMFANPQKAEEISRLGTTAIFQKCNELKEKENYEKAIICYEGAANLMPDSANVQFNLASSYYNYVKGKTIKDFEILNRAEEAIKKGLEKNPDDATAYSLYGDILQEKGKTNDSITQHKKAVEIKPNVSIFSIKLAFVLESAGKNDEAIKSYQQAISADPKDTSGLFFLARLYEKLGRLNEAIETIEKMNKIEPPNQETLDKLKSLKERQKLQKSKTN